MDGIGGAWPDDDKPSLPQSENRQSDTLNDFCRRLTSVTPNAECTFVLVLSDTGSILRMGVDGWPANLDKRFAMWLGDSVTSFTTKS